MAVSRKAISTRFVDNVGIRNSHGDPEEENLKINGTYPFSTRIPTKRWLNPFGPPHPNSQEDRHGCPRSSKLTAQK